MSVNNTQTSLRALSKQGRSGVESTPARSRIDSPMQLIRELSKFYDLPTTEAVEIAQREHEARCLDPFSCVDDGGKREREWKGCKQHIKEAAIRYDRERPGVREEAEIQHLRRCGCGEGPCGSDYDNAVRTLYL